MDDATAPVERVEPTRPYGPARRAALGAVTLSLGLHGLAVGLLERLEPAPSAHRSASVIEFSVVVPPAEAPEEDTPPQEPPSPEPPPVPAHARTVARPTEVAATPPEIATTPTPETRAPALLTGVTLTNLGEGSAWASAMGDGTDSTAPVGTSTRRAVPPPRADPTASKRPAIRVVPIGDLLQRPRAPDLNAALERNYPESARRRGLAGTATVRARIGPTGRVTGIIVANESASGFGQACRRTLEGSRWTPPRDQAGRAVHTDIEYRCRFRVNR